MVVRFELDGLEGDLRELVRACGDDSDSPLCTGEPATVTLTAEKDDVLSFRSDDAAGGNPRARLTKDGE